MNDVTKSSCNPKPPICLGILCRVVAQFTWENSSQYCISNVDFGTLVIIGSKVSSSKAFLESQINQASDSSHKVLH